ncbi:MAG: MFS transporter [Candidatus Lokiarchaeota archaeon]|nr:MFS transporter [Candidatus Lokiarchaeota archaeon]
MQKVEKVTDKLPELGARFTLIIFLITIIMNWADKNLFSPKLNAILEDFGFAANETTPLGIIAALFMITTGIGMVIFGVIADRGQRKWITIICSFVYSILTILTYFTPNGIAGYWYLFFMRLVGGFGLGAVVPAIFSMIGDYASPDKRASTFSKFTVATIIGQMGGLALSSGFSEWRVGYLTVGLFEFVMAVLMIFIKEPKKGVSEEELHSVLVAGAEYQFKFKKEDIKILWNNKSNKWIILNFIDTIPGSMVAFVLFKYLDDYYNIKESDVLILMGVGILGGIFGAILFGYIGDQLFKKNKNARAIIAFFCNLAPVFSYMLLFLPLFNDLYVPDGVTFGELISYPEVQFLTIIVFISLFINQGNGPNWYSSVLDVNLPEHRSTMISVASFADLLGNALGPLIGSLVYQFISGRAAMITVAIFWFANSLFWIPVIRNIKADIENNKKILELRSNQLKPPDN